MYIYATEISESHKLEQSSPIDLPIKSLIMRAGPSQARAVNGGQFLYDHVVGLLGMLVVVQSGLVHVFYLCLPRVFTVALAVARLVVVCCFVVCLKIKHNV